MVNVTKRASPKNFLVEIEEVIEDDLMRPIATPQIDYMTAD